MGWFENSTDVLFKSEMVYGAFLILVLVEGAIKL